MKWMYVPVIAFALSIAGPGMVGAQDQTQDRDQLHDCGSLGPGACADLLRIRDRLKDCDGSTSGECADLLRERDRLQDCADQDKAQDQTKDQTQDQTRDRDCAPSAGGSGGN